MNDGFVLVVTPSVVREYGACVTIDAKLNSRMVAILKGKPDDGLSVYATSTSLPAKRIAVAVCAPRTKLGPITYAIIAGLPFLPDPSDDGTTPDTAVNEAHYEYHGLSDAQLVDLANAIVAGKVAMDKDDVRKAVYESIEKRAMLRDKIGFRFD